MNYATWQDSVPPAIRGDLLWKLQAYRLALFVADASRADTKRAKDALPLSTIDQLVRATSSISVNIAEGYSRFRALDRARFYEYALGSARESRDWYYHAREAIGPIASARIDDLTQIIRLLIVMVARTRREAATRLAD